MSDSLVITSATTGPGKAVATNTINDVLSLDFDIAAGVLFVKHGNGKIQDFDLSLIATVTYSIASGVATITIAE